jgi:hypothetical protein
MLGLLLIAAAPARQLLSDETARLDRPVAALVDGERAPVTFHGRPNPHARAMGETVPQTDVPGGAIAIGLLVLLSILLSVAAMAMRNAQLPGRPARLARSRAEAERALALIARHWPQQIDASHVSMLRP